MQLFECCWGITCKIVIVITCVCIFSLLAIMYECSCLTCFYFFFIGIPCVHGCATIHYLKRDLADYLDNFFSVKNFIATR